MSVYLSVCFILCLCIVFYFPLFVCVRTCICNVLHAYFLRHKPSIQTASDHTYEPVPHPPPPPTHPPVSQCRMRCIAQRALHCAGSHTDIARNNRPLCSHLARNPATRPPTRHTPCIPDLAHARIPPARPPPYPLHSPRARPPPPRPLDPPDPPSFPVPQYRFEPPPH